MAFLLSEAFTQTVNEQVVLFVGENSTKPSDVAAFHLHPFTGFSLLFLSGPGPSLAPIIKTRQPFIASL